MSDDSFEMKPGNVNLACLEVLIQIHSRQEALTQLLLDRLSVHDEHKKEMLKNFNDDYRAAKKRIMEVIFEDYGHIDLKGLFDEDDTE